MKSNSEMLVTGGSNSITFWDMESGKILANTEIKNNITCSHSIDDDSYVIGSDDGVVTYWKNRKIIHSFEGHAGGVLSIDSNSTKFGRLMFVGSSGGSIRVWDIDKNRDKNPNAEYKTKNPVFSTSSLDGLKFCTGTYGGICVWDIGQSKCVAFLTIMKDWIRSTAFSNKYRLLISGLNGGFYLSPLDTTFTKLASQGRFVPQPNKQITTLDILNDTYVVTGNEDGEIYFYDLRKIPNPVKSLKISENSIRQIKSFNFPNSDLSFVSASIKETNIWTFKNEEIKLRRKFQSDENTSHTCVFFQEKMSFMIPEEKKKLEESFSNFPKIWRNFKSFDPLDTKINGLFKEMMIYESKTKSSLESCKDTFGEDKLPKELKDLYFKSIKDFEEYKSSVRFAKSHVDNTRLVFVGDFLEKNKCTGSGRLFKLIRKNKSDEILVILYQGQFNDGKYHGEGKEFDGKIIGKIVFEGRYINGMREVQPSIPERTNSNFSSLKINDTSDLRKKLDSELQEHDNNEKRHVRKRTMDVEELRISVLSGSTLRSSRNLSSPSTIPGRIEFDIQDIQDYEMEKEEEVDDGNYYSESIKMKMKKRKSTEILQGKEEKKIIGLRNKFLLCLEEFNDFKRLEELKEELEEEIEEISPILESAEQLMDEYENNVEKRMVINEEGKKETYMFHCKIDALTGRKEGQGKMFVVRDGLLVLLFDGEYKGGKRNGKGVEYYDNNAKKYIGEFKNDLRHGKGVVYQKDGFHKIYQGFFKMDRRHGRGTSFNEDGETISFRGRWRNGEQFLKDVDFEDVPKFDVKTIKVDAANNTLGRGNFGSVYKVQYNGKWVALKVFDFSGRTYDEVEKLVNSTEETLKMTMGFKNHPNIIKVFGFCKDGHVSYLLELCQKSVQNLIEKDTGRIALDEKVKILYQTCNGMDALHFAGIMHRDLKWENVLIDYNENIKIIDFDLAVLQHDYLSEWKVTREVGTPFFMDPRVLKKISYDDKCDVYSFGIMIYMLLFEKSMPYEYDFKTDKYIIDCQKCGAKVASVGQMKRHITECHLTPIIPKEYDKSMEWIVDLMKKCWNEKIEIRPSFHEMKYTLSYHGM